MALVLGRDTGPVYVLGDQERRSMVELPGAAELPPFGLGTGCGDGANVGGGDDGEPFDPLGAWSNDGAEAAGPDGNDGTEVAGAGNTVLGATDVAVHDEQLEPMLIGTELTPHAPEAQDGA